MAKWSTGAVVAVGLGAMVVGLGLGGRLMANYCVQVCPELLNRKPVPVKMNPNQRHRRGLYARRGGYSRGF